MQVPIHAPCSRCRNVGFVFGGAVRQLDDRYIAVLIDTVTTIIRLGHIKASTTQTKTSMSRMAFVFCVPDSGRIKTVAGDKIVTVRHPWYSLYSGRISPRLSLFIYTVMAI